MDWFNRIPRWHPRYQVEYHAADLAVRLTSSDDILQFNAPEVAEVAELVALQRPLAECCGDAERVARLPNLLYTLDGLARQGLIQDAAGPTAYAWITPDFSRPVIRHTLSPTLEVVLLSETLRLDDVQDASQTLARAHAHRPLALVFCDDYLDPRLDALHQQWRSQQVCWLPIRLSGSQAMAGPVITHQPGRPCWHCLSERLQRNQPVRTRWRHQPAGQLAGLPVPIHPDAIPSRLAQLLGPLRQQLMQAGHDLLTLDNEGNLDAHPCVWRPQCPACGNPQYLARQQYHPIALMPAPKLAGVHGGARTQTSQATVARLASCISPLTGVVAQLQALTPADTATPPVYHSSFFRPWRPDARTTPQACLGKGMSDAQSQASALCEAIERYAAGYQGDEAVVMGRAHSLSTLCVLPQSLLFFSAEQRAQARPGERAAHLPCEDDTLMAWSPAWSLTHHSARLLPLAACYADVPAPWSDYASWSSNGCASGNCREEAILQGLLEVVERDAVAIWWYNALPRPAYPSQHAGPAWLRTTQALGSDWDSWMLDLTHDMGIPVVAAIARHTGSGDWALGFGCSLEPTLAAERALTELIQLVAANKCLPAHWRDADAARVAFLYPGAESDFPPAWPAAHADIAEDIHTCVQALQRCGLEVLVHDYSRPDIPLHTVKVVVPGACHIWPERANPRLYQVPVALGWRDTPIAADALNPWDLYV